MKKKKDKKSKAPSKAPSNKRKLKIAAAAVLASLLLSVGVHQLLKPHTKYRVGDCFCEGGILCGKITAIDKDAYIADLQTPVGVLRGIRAPMKDVDADEGMIRVNCDTGEPLDAKASH